jgi:hypothetical protein
MLMQRLEAREGLSASDPPSRSSEDPTMDFDDTPQEAAFRARARAWLERNAAPRDPDAPAPDLLGTDREDDAVIARSKAWQTKKFDEGWACLTWPKEYGGQDLGRMEQVIWNQEEARFDTPPSLYAIGHGMLGPTILAHGTPAQKDRHLREMARGGGLVPALQRARRRERPRRTAHDRRAARRRVGAPGPEDLEHGRALLRLRDDRDALGSRRREARWSHLLHRGHARAGDRGAPDPPDQRRFELQRGVPERRAVSTRTGRLPMRLAGGAHDA